MEKLTITQTINTYDNPENASVGDLMEFSLKTGETVQAMKMTDDGIWCFVDCLKEEHDMKTMEAFLNGVLDLFPDIIRENMKPFEDGRFLRLPTEKEIFGENKYGKAEPDTIHQWEPMKLRRNRIAFVGLNGDPDWWWTETPYKGLRDVASATDFCGVTYDGNCYYINASSTLGVRPAFILNL